jgi:hypothetical protein
MGGENSKNRLGEDSIGRKGYVEIYLDEEDMFDGEGNNQEEDINELEFQDEYENNNFQDEFLYDYGDEQMPKSRSMYVQEMIPNLLNDMNDEDPDAFYSKADESNAFSEYAY